MPEEERYTLSEPYLRDRIAILLGGRLAEARAAITREFGKEEVEAEYSRLETGNAEADMALTAPLAIPDSGPPELTDYFLGDVLTWQWEAPGLHRVSLHKTEQAAGEELHLHSDSSDAGAGPGMVWLAVPLGDGAGLGAGA